MGARATGLQARFSPFRSFDLDSAVFLRFAALTFFLEEAWEVPALEIQQGTRHVPHVNGHMPGLQFVRRVGIDVLDEMEAAYQRLNELR